MGRICKAHELRLGILACLKAMGGTMTIILGVSIFCVLVLSAVMLYGHGR